MSSTMRAEGLIGLHDERVRRIRFAADGERRRRLHHGDARLDERVHEVDGVAEVGLIGRHDVAARIAQLLGRERRVERRIAARRRRATAAAPTAVAAPPAAHIRERRLAALNHVAGRRVVLVDVDADVRGLMRRERPVIFAAPLDLVFPHLVDAVQECLAVARREIEHRTVGGDRVIDRLPEVPDLLRLDRPPPARLRNGEARLERDGARVGTRRPSQSESRSDCGSTPSSGSRRSTTSSTAAPCG